METVFLFKMNQHLLIISHTIIIQKTLALMLDFKVLKKVLFQGEGGRVLVRQDLTVELSLALNSYAA